MLHILTTLFCLLSSSLSSNVDGRTADAPCYARYECRSNEMMVGDSMTIHLVAYSERPFLEVGITTKNFKIKGAHVRQLPKQPIREQRVRTEDGIAYAALLASYRISSETAGKVRLPALSCKARLAMYEQTPYQDFFSPFGFFVPRERNNKTEKKHNHSLTEGSDRLLKFKTSTLTILIKEKPKRSTEEAIRSGSRIV